MRRNKEDLKLPTIEQDKLANMYKGQVDHEDVENIVHDLREIIDSDKEPDEKSENRSQKSGKVMYETDLGGHEFERTKVPQKTANIKLSVIPSET